MIMTPQQNTLVSFLETNVTTVKDIFNKLKENGYYDPIKKSNYEWDVLYQLRQSVEKDNIFNNVICEYFPRVMFGRQKGHTTAAIEFIENNMNMNIGVMVTTKVQFDEIIRRLKEKTNNTRNVYWIRKNHNLDSLRGIRLDYIIIDTYGTIGISQKDFENILANSRNDIRIVGIGN